MPDSTSDQSGTAVAAMRLQNGYAHAIDTRDWEYFRTLFVPDVVADYPNRIYTSMDEWLDHFIPFHDGCTWTQHAMTNHVVGVDANGVWATCLGFVEWIVSEQPDTLNRARAFYRDRLVERDGGWLIARRRLDLVKAQRSTPIPADADFPISILGLYQAGEMSLR
jgi:hypothetical protein